MENYIAANHLCQYHQIEFSFLEALNEHGLIEIFVIEEQPSIREDYLPVLEKMIRLHFDLDINFEGLETVNHLLGRIQHMQEKITSLQNRLALYES